MPRVISPDTHNPAAQASAFKLIRLLRTAYPYIGELLTEDSPATLAQASLLEYLSWVINPAESHMGDEERVLAKANPNIKGTIQWIDYVNAPPSEQCSPEDKRMIFEQIKVIASTYPGGVWNAYEQHWSINKFYNQDTRSDATMMTPPAEALNLVCTALFDESRYLTEEGEWAHDLELRIRTTYLHFLSLRKESRAGLLSKCSAGLQHDVLYFLNESYLDKGAEAGGGPVELLMDSDSFLMGSLSSFVADCITKNSGEETNAMVLAWMDSDMNPVSEHPMIVWLRKIYASSTADADSGWTRACSEYISLRCEAFGLNPAQCRIADFVDALPSIPVVVSQDTILPLVSEIMRMGVLAMPQTQDSAWGPDSIYHLVDRRNRALELFKAQLPSEPNMMRLHAESIKDLFSALACVDSLYRYRDLSILVGAEDQRFQNTRRALRTLLLEYFNAYSLDKRIPAASFERNRSAYFTAERVFLEQSNADFIENFFALMGNGESHTFSAIWARLEALRHEMSAPHPLILSDAALRAWRHQSESMSADGQTMIDVTPYAINRLLLHGMLVPMRDWSPLYCEYLALLTNWLLRPSETGEGLLRQVKEAYPPYLLVNLLFMRLMKGADFDEALKERLFQLVQEQSPHRLSYGGSLFIGFLVLPQAELSEAQKTLMLTAISGQLGALIKNRRELLSLLKLPTSQLSEAQRTLILTAVEGQLGTLIMNNDDLYALFKLPTSQFSEAQRTIILTAVEGQLGTLIRNVGDLYYLFNFPTSQLSEIQRGMIWTAVAGQLGTLIGNGRELCALLKLSTSQLNEAQRAMIWIAVEGQLSTLIRSGDELRALFGLSTSELSETQRGKIWVAVEGQLGTLIRNGYELYCLFSLSTSVLSEAQRGTIWAAVEGQLGTLIKNGDDLYALFKLSTSELSEAQRGVILAAVAGQLGTLIKNFGELYCLLSLSASQFSESQRTLILTVVAGQLGTLIKNGGELQRLFNLSTEQLSEAQRAMIWTAVEGQLGTRIMNGDELCWLFGLSTSQLSEAQRGKIWAAVEGQLGTLIKNDDELLRLFYLPASKLSEAQRGMILTAKNGTHGLGLNPGGFFKQGKTGAEAAPADEKKVVLR